MKLEIGSYKDWREATPLFLIPLAIAASAWFLQAAAIVMMPVAFGIVLAFLLRPIQTSVARVLPKRLRGLSVLTAMFCLLIVVAAAGGVLYLAAQQVASQGADYPQKIESELRNARGWLESKGVPAPEVDLEEAVKSLQSQAMAAVSTLSAGVTIATVVFFITLLSLMESDRWFEKFSHLECGDLCLEAARSTAVKVRQYLWVRTIISVISGVLEGAYLWMIGMDLVLLWGFLFFILNYIPVLGSIIAGIPMVLVAFITGGVDLALLAILGVVALEHLIGNLLEPMMQGRKLVISPVFLFVSLSFWTWAWGWPGAFLSVPLAATIVVAFSYVPLLKPLGYLLGNTADEEEFLRRTQVAENDEEGPPATKQGGAAEAAPQRT